MGDCMSTTALIQRCEEVAQTLRNIADSKQLGDGTKETWACGIGANIILDYINYLKFESNP